MRRRLSNRYIGMDRPEMRAKRKATLIPVSGRTTSNRTRMPTGNASDTTNHPPATTMAIINSGSDSPSMYRSFCPRKVGES